MSGRRAVRRLSGQQAEFATVIDMTVEGQGIASLAGKRVFIHGAIAGESVSLQRTRRRRNYDEAELVSVEQASADRVLPRCEYFGRCGGCSLQHLDPPAQLRMKEIVLLENLRRIGEVKPERVLPPVTGPAWGYRRRARLAVRDVPGKGRVLVGFRERLRNYVMDMRDCQTLHPEAARLIAPLSELIGGLSLRARLPQVEVAVADNATALVLRVLDEPTAGDREALARFRDCHGVRLYLQRTRPATVEPLDLLRDGGELYYHVPEQDLKLQFGPLDFIQVNGEINRHLIALALELLSPAANMRVLDLYCGLGNFTLALARHAREVCGIELEPTMIARARANAAGNGIANVRFEVADLSEAGDAAGGFGGAYDLALLDPPRAGAEAALAPLAATGATRIVYVSCHPGTLARDAGILVAQLGYRLTAAGVLDMFPNTGHVESVAVFERA
jgi:23S rRNA (uracil1939-C5)-methyltransferase